MASACVGPSRPLQGGAAFEVGVAAQAHVAQVADVLPGVMRAPSERLHDASRLRPGFLRAARFRQVVPDWYKEQAELMKRQTDALEALRRATDRNSRITTWQNWVMLGLTLAIAVMTAAVLR
jgi:hypothetical protein